MTINPWGFSYLHSCLQKNYSVQRCEIWWIQIFLSKGFYGHFISACGLVCFSTFWIRLLQCCSYSKPNLGYSKFEFTSCWSSSYVFFNTSSRFPWNRSKFFNMATITIVQMFYFLIWSASCSINLSWWLSHWSNQASRIAFILASCFECQLKSTGGWQNQINLQEWCLATYKLTTLLTNHYDQMGLLN
jgi:hypothetical protein